MEEEKTADTVDTVETIETVEPVDSVWRHVFSLKNIISIIFYTTVTVRASSFPSWLYPWLQWTFSIQDEELAEANVSLAMDIYGYSYFLSIFIAPLPGMFIKYMQRIFKSDRLGEHHALTVILLIAGWLNKHSSLQCHGFIG